MIAQQCDRSGPTRSQFQDGVRHAKDLWGRDRGRWGWGSHQTGCRSHPVQGEQEGRRVRSQEVSFFFFNSMSLSF